MLELPPVPSLTPYFRDWVAHETDDDYWRAWKISDHYTGMKAKACMRRIADIFLKGSIKNFMGMRAGLARRRGQRLMVGPWAHAATSPEGEIGDVTFGKSAVLDMTGTLIAWSDFALKGVQNEYATGAPVRIFVMGDNVWRDERNSRCAPSTGTTTSSRGALASEAARDEAPQIRLRSGEPGAAIGGRLCCRS